VYGDPLEMARKWVRKGAEWLHVVDLDGAFEGVPKNLNVLREMTAAVPGTKIQVGGGIRNMSTVETLFDGGIKRIVLGTAAVEDPTFVMTALAEHAGNVAIGIDARDGIAQVAGWTQNSQIAAVELARKLHGLGVDLIIYTDIARDGVLEGP